MNNSKLRLILTGLFILFFSIKSINAGQKFRVAIIDFENINTTKSNALAVRNMLEVSLYQTNVFEILERNKMKSILKEQGLQMTGCIDTSCAVQIGRVLSADMVIMGSLIKLKKYTIALKFVNVREGNIKLADSETAGTEDDIQTAVNVLAKRIGDTISKRTKSIDDTKKIDKIVKNTITEKKDDLSIKGLCFSFSVNGLYISPQGSFNNLIESGYGIAANMKIENIFLQNLFMGIEPGYGIFPGKKANIDRCIIFPVLISAGYRHSILNWLYVEPFICGGISYNIMEYDNDGIAFGQNPEYIKEYKTEPMSKAGLNLGFMIMSLIQTKIGVSYCSIFEKDGALNLLMVNAGLGVKF